MSDELKNNILQGINSEKEKKYKLPQSIKNRKNILKKLLEKYSLLLTTSQTPLNNDAIVKRFEVTFIYSLEIIEEILIFNKIAVGSKKTSIRDAHKIGLIGGIGSWFEFISLYEEINQLYINDNPLYIYELVREGFKEIIDDLMVNC